VKLIEENVISSKIAREVFEFMWAGEGAPADIVEKRGLKQVSDTGALEAMVDKLIAANPGQADAVKAKPQAMAGSSARSCARPGARPIRGRSTRFLRRKLGVEVGGALIALDDVEDQASARRDQQMAPPALTQ